MGCCSNLSKNILFGLNVIDCVLGLVVVVFGLILLVKLQLASEWYLWIPCFLVGGLLLLTSITSECGKCCMYTKGGDGSVGCRCLLTMSNALSCMLLFLELLTAVIILLTPDQVEAVLRDATKNLSPTSLDGFGTFCCGGSAQVHCPNPACFRISESDKWHHDVSMSVKFHASGLEADIAMYPRNSGDQPFNETIKYTYGSTRNMNISSYARALSRKLAKAVNCSKNPASSLVGSCGTSKLCPYTLEYDNLGHTLAFKLEGCEKVYGNDSHTGDTLEATLGRVEGTATKSWSTKAAGAENTVDFYNDYHNILAFILFGLAAVQLVRIFMARFVKPGEVEDDLTEQLNSKMEYQNRARQVRSLQRDRVSQQFESEGRAMDPATGFRSRADIDEGSSCTVQ